MPKKPHDKKRWLEELNTCIAQGSESLFHRNAEDYERVLNERIKFFRMLGWTDPRTDIGRAFEVFSVTHPQLASPQNTVDTLNILGWYEVRPLVPIITKRFMIVLSTAEKIQQRAGAILDSGFGVNEALQQRANLGGESPAVIRKRLERRKQRLIKQGLYDTSDSGN
jgi:hypothetical protein